MTDVVGGGDDWIRFHICKSPHWSGVTRLGVAVSGGGDSMALLHVLAGCAPDQGVTLEAATVDHGLRAGSAEEARFVSDTCQSLDFQHEILLWSDWSGQGNLQAEARAARYRLLADWARRRELDVVALAHTKDDQAETFLMRLAREAGVDGLAAMDTVFERDGARFWRPALALGRAELRDYLVRHGLAWRDDPSNEDEAFDRVRARKALAVLGEFGIDAATLRGVALNLASASDALKRLTGEKAGALARVEHGDVVFDRQGLFTLPHELLRRLLVAALVWVSGATYPPRRDALFDLERAVEGKTRHSLHGCLITTDDAKVRVAREFNPVKDLRAPLDTPWDGRWQITAPEGETRPNLTIRALGDAVSQCPDWRATGLPRTSLMASPSVWDGQVLVSAPIAGYSAGFSAEINHPRGDFLASLLSD